MSGKQTGISGSLAPLPDAGGQWWATHDELGTTWIEIGVVSYHQQLDNVFSEVHCAPVWPHWPVVSAFEDALRTFGDTLEDSQQQHILHTAFNVATSGYHIKQFREQPVTAEGATGISAYVVSGPVETVRKYVLRWLDDVVADSEQVGGDDSYYDYYPDEVYCLAQLCVALGLEAPYKAAYGYITTHRYADDTEDTLPTWDETVPKGAS